MYLYLQASLRKQLNNERLILLFCKFPRNNGLSQKVGLFDVGFLACINPAVGGGVEIPPLLILPPPL